MEFSAFLIAFTAFFLLGMPIAVAMISSSFLYCLLKGVDLSFMGIQMFTGLNTFVLIAIPLFILTAEVMSRTSVADRIFKFCNDLVGYVPGGLAHVNISTSVIFAGMSGSAVADVGGIGHLSYQAMVDEGFDKEFSAAVTIASSTVGPIIPPSIPAVVYAMVANVSVGKILFGGVIPGLLMAAILSTYVYFVSLRRRYPCKKFISWRIYFRNLLFSFFRCIPPLLTPVILLGGIYLGVVTATEASGMAVLYALILGLIVYRSMDMKSLVDCFTTVFKTSGAILLIIPAAKAFGFVLTREHLQETVFNFVMSFAGTSPILIVTCIMILFLLLGCLNDPNVNIMLFVPMILPLINVSGFDHVHMAVCIILMAMIGNITPPVGIVTMTVCSIEKLNFERICKILVPFILILLGEVVLLLVFPQIVMFLPNMIMK
jgi:tripartite ATP-independent transporter DctM subunit